MRAVDKSGQAPRYGLFLRPPAFATNASRSAASLMQKAPLATGALLIYILKSPDAACIAAVPVFVHAAAAERYILIIFDAVLI